MSDVLFLGEQLRKGYSDDPWHGPDTTSLLADVSAEKAAAHPVAGAHSIWEIVLHMTAWQNQVRRRLGGKEPGLPEEGDWSEPGEISAAAWCGIGTPRRVARRAAAGAGRLHRCGSGAGGGLALRPRPGARHRCHVPGHGQRPRAAQRLPQRPARPAAQGAADRRLNPQRFAVRACGGANSASPQMAVPLTGSWTEKTSRCPMSRTRIAVWKRA